MDEQERARRREHQRRMQKRQMKRKLKNMAVCLVIGVVIGLVLGLILSHTGERGAALRAQKEQTRITTQKAKEDASEDKDKKDEQAEAGETGETGESGETFESETEPEDNEIHTVNILATGDNLIHTGIFTSGYKADGTYNYDHLYEHVKDDITAADLAIINQETIFTNNRNDYSGYPMFAGPVEIGDAVVNAGFDVVTHATNHVFDRNVQGINDTLEFWKTKHPEITVLGIHESQEDQDTIKTVEVNGITFALLNYTYGMNGFVLPSDQPYLVDILDEAKVVSDIAKAKEISDCVIFFLHSGVEYVYEPDASTKQWVNLLLENGVDICVGGHPHVLEPYTMLTRADGHKMLVYYSMGNFISTQDEYPRMIGGFAKFTVQKQGKNITVTDYTLDPLYTHYNHNTGVYTVYKLSDYTDELASQHQLYYKYGNPITVDVIRAKFDEIMSTPINQPGYDNETGEATGTGGTAGTAGTSGAAGQ